MHDQPPRLDRQQQETIDTDEIRRDARQEALDRLRRAVAESEASGEAAPFDMDTWLEEQDRLDSAA